MAAMLLKYALPFGGLCAAERYIINNHGDVLLGLGNDSKFAVPKAYGIVTLVNVVISGLIVVSLSFKVGEARKKYDVPLPKMQAEGDSDNARMFNCVQRGHHQALETYPQFLAFSLVGGLRHPFVTAACGVLWGYARLQWACGYATGDPQARYTHSKWAFHIWTGLLGVMFAAVSSSFGIMGIF